MRVLVTGAGGMLGRALREKLQGAHTLFLWGREEADLTDVAQVRVAAQGITFDAVVHAAAMTDVDRCESEPERALAVNRDAAANVAGLARDRGALFVYLSTDYVFDGAKRSPYLEEDPVGPINAYGRSKLEGERAVSASGARCLVVRTSWLFGSGGKNFVDTVASKLERGESLRVVDDQKGSPTYTRDLAHAIELLLRRGATGTVHATNSGTTTWYGLAREIARVLGSDAPIAPVTTEEFPRPAARPRYSVLSGARFRAWTGENLRPWEEAVGHYLAARRSRSTEEA
ncbi:MAG TPA: dTDP-4-dehydrorhamnose reductase [Candidatus Eisenbacteria bacterium]|nr:dTDP-4-dehydrorhamnose reductase [Candidatus Eisenbacteria bacterium]